MLRSSLGFTVASFIDKNCMMQDQFNVLMLAISTYVMRDVQNSIHVQVSVSSDSTSSLLLVRS